MTFAINKEMSPLTTARVIDFARYSNWEKALPAKTTKQTEIISMRAVL